jgi:hypothetical protein
LSKWFVATLASALVLVALDFLLFGGGHWLWIAVTFVSVEVSIAFAKLLGSRR